jgi:NAD(P)-dependent dehydrogenase (short-subunit alcohol dehydrogenase family)
MNPPAKLAGLHALVTGASRGIGAEIAAALISQGVRVSLLGRDANSLADVAQRVSGGHAVGGAAAPTPIATAAAVPTAEALPVEADVTDAASVKNAFDTARAHFGPIQILINNAGQAHSAKFTDTDEALWNRLIAVNLTGTYLCSRQAVPDMLQAGFGRIVNVASVAGLHGGPYISAYASSKHAVIGLTRSLAVEYATRNITVNAVCPGYVDTEMTRNTIANIMSKTGRSESETLAALLASNPQKRLVQPREVADTVLWVCQPGSASVTGQSIILAGGEVT